MLKNVEPKSLRTFLDDCLREIPNEVIHVTKQVDPAHYVTAIIKHLGAQVLDGWWIEACIEGVTGWSIGVDGDDRSDGRHAAALYDKLTSIVLPLYYENPARWRWMMKQAIGNIAHYFNSQRMMRRYVAEAYLR
jgi:hypothetical protein